MGYMSGGNCYMKNHTLSQNNRNSNNGDVSGVYCFGRREEHNLVRRGTNYKSRNIPNVKNYPGKTRGCLRYNKIIK